jgi:hypothetical protein
MGRDDDRSHAFVQAPSPHDWQFATDNPVVSLSVARKRARHAYAAIDEGRDPAGEQQVAKARPTDSVDALVKDYVAKHVCVKQRGWKEEERILNIDVLPSWKTRSVRELTRRDVRALIAPIVDCGSPIMANRVLAVVRRMLNFGVRNDWLDANPASLIESQDRKCRARASSRTTRFVVCGSCCRANRPPPSARLLAASDRKVRLTIRSAPSPRPLRPRLSCGS